MSVFEILRDDCTCTKCYYLLYVLAPPTTTKPTQAPTTGMYSSTSFDVFISSFLMRAIASYFLVLILYKKGNFVYIFFLFFNCAVAFSFAILTLLFFMLCCMIMV